MNTNESFLLKFTCLLCGLALIHGAKAAEIFIDAPGLGGPGNTSALQPFAFEQAGATSIRYQQVYSASEFRNELPQGGFISALIFASDYETGRNFITGWPSVQIDLSVAQRGADELSSVFADNVGADALTVYPNGPLSLTGTAQGTTSRISFQNPYFYDPAQGNLLLEIRIFSPSGFPNDPFRRAGPLEAYDNILGSDTVSRVFAYDANATSGIADSIGLLTIFVATPVPEPSTTALTVLAISVFGSWLIRRRLASKKG
jgi:PEP-CTERM motif-containing protein